MYEIAIYENEQTIFKGEELLLPLAVNVCQRKLGFSKKVAEVTFNGVIIYRATSGNEEFFSETGEKLDITQIITLLFKEQMKVYQREAMA